MPGIEPAILKNGQIGWAVFRFPVALFVGLLLSTGVQATPVDDIETAKVFVAWVYEHVPYIATKYIIKTPAQTLLTGGDCADMSALLLWLLADSGITYATMVVMELYDYTSRHAVVELHDWWFDGTTGKAYSKEDFPLRNSVAGVIRLDNLLVEWGQSDRN